MNTITDVKSWIRNYIADVLQADVSAIKDDVDFVKLGLDSSSAAALVGDLEDWMGIEIDTTLIYEHTSIETLSEKLVEAQSEVHSS